MRKKNPEVREMSWEEFFKEFPGEPLEVLKKRHAEDVKWAEDRMATGPEDGLRIRINPGRPPKGQEAPVQVKAVKMPAEFWALFETQAAAAGLSLHAAMRSALLEWASKHRAS